MRNILNQDYNEHVRHQQWNFYRNSNHRNTDRNTNRTPGNTDVVQSNASSRAIKKTGYVLQIVDADTTSETVHSAHTEFHHYKTIFTNCLIDQSAAQNHLITTLMVSRHHIKERLLCQLVREPIYSVYMSVSLTQPLRFWWRLRVISPPVWFSQSNPLFFVTFIRFTPIPCLLFIKWSEESNYLQILLAGVQINFIAWITFMGLQAPAVAMPTAPHCGIIHWLPLSITRSVLQPFRVQW